MNYHTWQNLINEYNVFYTSEEGDKMTDKDIPKKYVVIQSRDSLKFSLNECPTCRRSIGYRPKEKDFRCPNCEQRILWE